MALAPTKQHQVEASIARRLQVPRVPVTAPPMHVQCTHTRTCTRIHTVVFKVVRMFGSPLALKLTLQSQSEGGSNFVEVVREKLWAHR